MEKLKYNILVIVIALSAIIGTEISANTVFSFKKELKREVHEHFIVSPDALLTIVNKYGNININTWDQNKIQIDVYMTVKSGSTSKAQEFIDDIKIDFNSSTRGVSATTIYPDSGNGSWFGWLFGSSNIDYEVHYEIKTPKQINIDITDKYGNISVTTIDGNADIVNKYGNISMQNISGNLDLQLGYGKASVEDLKDANVLIKYSKLKMGICDNINIDSKYSTINIKECILLDTDSKYDEYTIGTLSTLANRGHYDDWNIDYIDVIKIRTKYSDIEINTLNGRADFDTSYGEVDIDNCTGSVESIEVEARYTDYTFGTIGDYRLQFDGSYTDLDTSNDFVKTHYSKDGSSLEVKGYRGSSAASLLLKVSMSYGDFDLD
ncbi:MAG: hypothetical protein V3V14_03775 [Saprospiraceae bacterium]